MLAASEVRAVMVELVWGPVVRFQAEAAGALAPLVPIVLGPQPAMEAMA
jgi:hypothetical protein